MTPTAVIGSYTAALTIDGSTNYLLIQPGSSSTAYKKINRNVFLGVTGQPMDINSIQTVSNKILDNTNTITVRDGVFTLQDDVDLTKQARFQLSGITTATTRTYTLPDASSTIADISTAQTLTNKTLTNPVITGGSIDNSAITVDSISGHTSSTTGTIYGIAITSGVFTSNNIINTNAIVNDAVTAPKMSNTGTWDSSWSWQTWVPSYTNFTPGNGTLTFAKYTQVGKTVFVRIHFILGSTSVVSGRITFSLPVTSVAYSSLDEDILGNAMLRQTGTNNFLGVTTWLSTTTAGLDGVNAASTSAIVSPTSATVPFTWANTHEWGATFTYEAA